MTMYEMQELRPKTNQPTTQTKAGLDATRDVDAATAITSQAIWAYTTSALFLAVSLTLLLLPDSLLFLMLSRSSEDEYGRPRPRMTHLEIFLVTQLGLLTMTFAVAILFSMPIDSPGVAQSSITERRHPLLYPITIASALSAVVSLKAPRQHMPSLYNFVTAVTSGLAVWGLWLILFRQSRSALSAKPKTSRPPVPP